MEQPEIRFRVTGLHSPFVVSDVPGESHLRDVRYGQLLLAMKVDGEWKQWYAAFALEDGRDVDDLMDQLIGAGMTLETVVNE